MNTRFYFGAWFVLLLAQSATAQLVAIDTTKPILVDEIVVTATRTAKSLEQVPVPVTVIPAAEIQMQGATNLSDVLSGQLGFNLQYNRLGSVGVQLHGLDAGYTLILVDGEPVVGNIEGFVDISRIPVANIERVEITHGPASSLYGSDALAGVINIITRKGSNSTNSTVKAQYGAFGTVDLTGQVDLAGPRASTSLYVNRYSTDGYDLNKAAPGPTVPPFENYDVGLNGEYRLGQFTKIKSSGRLAYQNLQGISAIQQGTPTNSQNQQLIRVDWSIAPSITHQFSPLTKARLSFYNGRSTADANYQQAGQSTLTDYFNFDQFRSQSEFQLDHLINSHFLLTGGGGITVESVSADFMAGDRKRATSSFAYGQVEWIPSKKIDVISSARLDAHPDYTNQVNPKLALMYTFSPDLKLKASVGRGFRAPTFEQRYVNFTNPLGGNYTVLGTDGLQQSLQAFEDAGLIREWLVDRSTLTQVKPETSISYSLGVTFDLSRSVSLQSSLFRNDVNDLIETRVLAIKKDGQNLFSYVNLAEVFTQGFDVDASARLFDGAMASVGYQYLEAQSKTSGSTLAGRSRHSGRIQLQGSNKKLGLTGFLRGIYKSSYPFVTGTNIVVGGHSVWDVSLTKELSSHLQIGVGADNVFDFTEPAFLPEEPGRRWFARLILNP
ncbi:MAG: TonB-dependent receptor [Rhodothermales bacterium]